jgi:hypothetical protein
VGWSLVLYFRIRQVCVWFGTNSHERI